MTVGIVNDLRIAREALRQIVAGTPGFQVLWTANEGRAAVAQHAGAPADIILMDLLMPELDGVETTRQLMAQRPCAILVVTASVVANRQMVFAAMSAGALDAVNTPDASSPESVAQLRRKLLTVSRLVSSDRGTGPVAGGVAAADTTSLAQSPTSTAAVPIIGIGASTGGPQAIATILRALPVRLPAAIVLVQHLDRQFVSGFQDWLGRESPLPVLKAEARQPIVAGSVFLAHSEEHLVITEKLREQPCFAYTAHPLDAINRPSVDVFFQSLVELQSTPRAGVLLTGMGRDGAAGLLALRRAGAPTLAQDAASSVVYGMPRAALELAAVDAATPLLELPDRIVAIAEALALTARQPLSS